MEWFLNNANILKLQAFQVAMRFWRTMFWQTTNKQLNTLLIKEMSNVSFFDLR